MHTVPLSPKLADKAHEVERTTEAAIAGEIARHFLDYKEDVSASRASSFLVRLAAIHTANPEALWVILRLLSGDLNEITRSYSDLGKENSRSKQAYQQSLERVIFTLETHWPECAHAIIQLRHITAKINK